MSKTILSKTCKAQTWTAYGETKTANDWSKDHRCVVMLDTILKRLTMGWTIEHAIRTLEKNG